MNKNEFTQKAFLVLKENMFNNNFGKEGEKKVLQNLSRNDTIIRRYGNVDSEIIGYIEKTDNYIMGMPLCIYLKKGISKEDYEIGLTVTFRIVDDINFDESNLKRMIVEEKLVFSHFCFGDTLTIYFDKPKYEI